MNAFTQATTPDLSATLAEVGAQHVEPQPVISEEAADRTARLAAVALNPEAVADGYRQLTAQYSDNIKASGDREVRYAAAAKETEGNLRGLYRTMNEAPQLDPTGQLSAQLQAAAKSQMEADVRETARYALEKQAFEQIQQLAAGGDSTQARVLIDQIRLGGAEDQRNDIMVKKMILGNLVAKAGIEDKDKPWFNHVIDFALQVIPFEQSHSRGGLVDVDPALRQWSDFILSGRRYRAEASTLYKQDLETFARSAEELVNRVKDHSTLLGYQNHSEQLNLLAGIHNTPSTHMINAEDAMNNVLGVIPFERLLSIPSIMVRAGARKEAASLIADATITSIREGAENAARATGIPESEVIAHNLPSALNVAGPINEVPLTGDALAGVERGEALIRSIPELEDAVQAGRMTNPEFMAAIEKNRARLNSEYGRELKDFRVNPQRLSTGQNTYVMEFDLGKQKGGGFASARTAEDQARAMGVPDPKIVQDESGQWFIRVQTDMPETSFYTSNLQPGLARTGIVGKMVLGARQIDDELLFSQARSSANARNKILQGITKDFQKKFGKVVGTDEYDYLANAAAWGENNSTWLRRAELDVLFERQGAQRPVSDKAWDAYEALREVNDIEFALRNDVDYATKLAKGFETVSFNRQGFKAERVNGLVDRHPQNLPPGDHRILDLSTGVHYNKGKGINPLTQERLKQMADDGYALVQLEEPLEAGGVTVKHVLIKKGELDVSRLRRDQLAYRAGGHRLYADKYFVKQTSWGVQADTKEKFLKSPNTFIAGTKAETMRWAQIMDHARILAKNEADITELDAILAPLDGWDGKRFMDLVEQGKIDLDSEIQAMYDREMPRDYIQDSTAQSYANPDESGYTGWLKTKGSMYYSSKGEHLENWTSGKARTVDPFETANIGIRNIANLASFSDYKMSAVSRWVKTYGDFLATDHLPKGASDMTIFSQSKFNSNLDSMPMGAGRTLKHQMEAQRDIITRNLGWRTEWDREVEQWKATIDDFVMGRDPTSARHETARKAIDYWSDKNPVNSVRKLVFDMKMGFFNWAQFPLQIQTMLATTALAGWKKAGPAYLNLPSMRRYLMGTIEENEHLLDFSISRGIHEAAEMSPEEYRTMMRMAKKSGFFEIHNSHQMMDYYGPSAVTGGVRSGYDKFTRGGRFFFNEGEMWNRIMAWQVAYKEVLETTPFPAKFNKATEAQFFEEFMRKTAARADDYSINMTKESGAAWQQGLASIPTQFWAYNARMMETYFGKQFTRGQKLNLLVAQTFFYGAAGVPLASAAMEMWNKSKGDAPELGSIPGMIERGAMDHVIWLMTGGGDTGADVLAGKRYGTGSWSAEIISSMFGMSPYGEKSVVDMMGGATYQISKDTAKSLWDVARFVAAESGTGDYPLTQDSFMRAAKNISSFSNGMKAYVGFKYNAYYSNKGTLVGSDLPTADAFFFGLGIQPGEQDEIAAMMGWQKDRKKQVEEVSKYIVNQRARMAVEGQHVSEISEETNAILRLLPPDLRTRALKDANAKTDKSLYESLAERVEKDKRQQELLKEYGQTN